MEEGVLLSERKEEKEKALDAEGRLSICRGCPLYMSYDGVCNPSLWLNVKTGEVARRKREGFIRGCGCLITKKVHNRDSHCHAGKW